MIKKKAPVIPITIVVIALAGVFAMNAKSHPVDPEQARKDAMAAQIAQNENKPRPADDPSKVDAAMKSSLGGPAKTGDPEPQPPMAAKGPPGGPPGRPGADGILVSKKPRQYKPTPGETSTGSQWYRN